MSNYKDTMAYKLYKRAEENLETGIAVEELVEKILKEIINAAGFGRTETWFGTEEYLLRVISGATEVLTDMGFKVFWDAPMDEDELYILWDYSEEDAKEGEE